jgi:hypothetical protein
MVKFACVRCHTVFQAPDPQAGQKFNCSSCGQRLEIPPAPINKTALAPLVDQEAPVVPVATPLPDTMHEVVARPLAMTVRYHGYGLESGRFKTSQPIRAIVKDVDEMLFNLGLDWDHSGQFSGQLRHSYTFFCTIKVSGDARSNRDKTEFVIDLSWHSSWSVAAILIAIFLFPLGLILGLVFTSIAQTEGKRLLDDALRSLRRNLQAD